MKGEIRRYKAVAAREPCGGTYHVGFERMAENDEKPYREHSGNKYRRLIRAAVPDEGYTDGGVVVDVYNVLEAFGVVCPALQHALKKLLCAGLRGKGDKLQDLREAADAVQRAIVLEGQRQPIQTKTWAAGVGGPG